jgi:hypothetical protein
MRHVLSSTTSALVGDQPPRLAKGFVSSVVISLLVLSAPLSAIAEEAVSDSVAQPSDVQRMPALDRSQKFPVTPFRFKVVRGKAKVCGAYAESLNRLTWHTEPFCFRGIAPGSSGFWQPKLVPIESDELERIWPDIRSLLYGGNTTTYFARNPHDRVNVVEGARVIAGRDQRAASLGAIEQQPWSAPSHFRYVPAIDVDNDGAVDNIVFSREVDYYCGGDEPNNPFPRVAPVDAFVLGVDGRVNVEKTIRLFYPGAPKLKPPPDSPGGPGWFGWKRLPRAHGMFQFEGRAFTDNAVLDLPQRARAGTIEVYEHRNRKRIQVCGITWQTDSAGQRP